METWAHGQDVADALGHERRATDRLRHVAHLGVRARPFSYLVRGRHLPAGRIDVVLDWSHPARCGVGTSARTWPDERESRASRVRRSISAWWSPSGVNVADTDLAIEGEDAVEWMSIAQAFAGPPGPGRPSGDGEWLRRRRPRSV